MIDPDDLALLTVSLSAAMQAAPGAAAADAALFELGWGDLLDAAPVQGAAAAFGALGATGSGACLLDDVVANALGLQAGPEVCVILPAPQLSSIPGALHGDRLVVDGLVSARIDSSSRVLVALDDDGSIRFGWVDASLVRGGSDGSVVALDPASPFRRARFEVFRADTVLVELDGTWKAAVCNARVALAAQLIGGSRAMLELARQHAVDRVQFGRAISTFQAVRHKLAESLVAIEGAASVTAACTEDCDPLLAATAKSLAGKAARVTATHAQQVLAGIGFTTDHTFHLSLKRTLVLDTLFGSARTLPTEIGLALLAQHTAPRLVEL